MKLLYHPASTTSRPIMLFAAESGIALDAQVVDLFTGEHVKPPFSAINPNQLVPVLIDGDFVLTESAAILKYLADKVDSPAYPTDLRQRARVNERMDWFNTQLTRDFAYGFVYPQIFPMHRRENAVVQAATLAWGKERARAWLRVLDEHLIGPENNYVCGSRISLADYLGASLLALGEVARCDYSAYPNVARWFAGMKRLRHWSQVNKAIEGYAATLSSSPFETL